ncbi:tRNA lysidine(34) synthetase TilS [Acidobacteria bacterium AH-259-D05]|nr:tRNA lysidine(34) synthetase TilS [Acidobacteria bacterium AH-259-D05]
MISRVVETIRRHQLLEEGDRVLVALSGGPDSVALLLALREVEESFSLQLSAAHVNHQLRGEESDQDEQFVRGLCREAGISLEVKQIDTQQEIEKSGENLESCARRLRYDFLFQLALRGNSRVATGHTLNDQAETFLMKLIRGAGPAGLSGICPLRVNRIETDGEPGVVTVVRPLLEIRRQEILDYLANQGQTFRKDRSNQDLSFDRNWVRHELIPLLQDKLNPALLETFHRATELFREIEEFLLEQGKEAFDRCKVSSEQETRIRIGELGNFPSIIQKQVVRQAALNSKGDLHNITLRHIAEVLQMSLSRSGKEIHLPGGLKVQREFDQLRFTLETGTCPFLYQLSIPGEIFVKEVGKSVGARRVEGGKQGLTLIKWTEESLTVRNRRPGDEYRLSLGSQKKKLKALFQKNRIPKSRRDKLLIIEGNNEIIWVEGFPPHPKYRVSRGGAGTVEIEVRHETLDH